ncbi:hypothetical protein CASFOL_007421 [Castilleja foliolosa]|uniref:Uncharacterized protein n=1 Tax=Castilleja foliolosa TaxID=1961234 RepID=A0ABD3E9J5_9LAMI
MANEPSSISYNTPSPSPSSTADSYIGSFISVTSKCEIRYEGVLYYLNPQDSTFGLKDVRSYGTEGRNKIGQQVPPSDKVYEYILFRGSDIKDLRVITGPPAPVEESIYNDPAVVQSNSIMGLPSPSRSVSATVGSSAEHYSYTEPSASNAKSYANITPSGAQSGIWAPSQSAHIPTSSYGMSTQWQGYNGAPCSISGLSNLSNIISTVHTNATSSSIYLTPTPTRTYEQLSTPFTDSFPSNLSLPTQLKGYSGAQGSIYSSSNLSNNIYPGHSNATSSSINLTPTPTLTSEKTPVFFIDSVSSKPSFPFQPSTLANTNVLTTPFSLTYQNASSVEAQAVNRVAPDPAYFLPIQPVQNFVPPVAVPISDPPKQVFLTSNLSQPKLSEHSPAKILYPDQKDIGVMSSTSLNFSSSDTTPALQPSLLPLPPLSQKLHSLQFTEEFDFQAMNEKFKKDEVWGYLGKANLREKVDGTIIHENGTSTLDPRNENPEMTSKSDPQPAYNKDDFFDTISCNSVGRGARNGQNRFSERMKFDTQHLATFKVELSSVIVGTEVEAVIIRARTIGQGVIITMVIEAVGVIFRDDIS